MRGTPGGCLLVAHVVCAICESGVANPRCAGRPAAIGRAVRATLGHSARFELQCPDGVSFAACRAGKVIHCLDRQLSTQSRRSRTAFGCFLLCVSTTCLMQASIAIDAYADERLERRLTKAPSRSQPVIECSASFQHSRRANQGDEE